MLTNAQETKQLTLEEIDLLFGERALGTLPEDLNVKGAQEEHELRQIGHEVKVN
jgi:hypothetical protein